jgi:hypothetical protein
VSALAPIAVFVFNRPQHAEETLAYLARNDGANDSDLIIFSDGPRSARDEPTVRETRSVLAGVSGFRSVRVVERSENWGLARSIVAGVTDILETSDCVIVLEDDMVTSPQFLTYMNAGLTRFANDDRVGSVHGYMYPIADLPDFFFMRGGDCWGWGTWRDRWRLFEADGARLLKALKQQGLLAEFNRTGGNRMIRMLVDQIRGKNNSWFIRWHASLFLHGKLTLQPGKSFVHNTGLDSTGTHCETTDVFDVLPAQDFSGLPDLDIRANPRAVAEIRAFFERTQTSSWYRRFANRVVDGFQARVAANRR